MWSHGTRTGLVCGSNNIAVSGSALSLLAVDLMLSLKLEQLRFLAPTHLVFVCEVLEGAPSRPSTGRTLERLLQLLGSQVGV